MEAPLQELRQQYGDIYQTSLTRVGKCWFRALTVGEQDQLAMVSEFDVEDFLCKSAIVWPEDVDLDRAKPGEISQLARTIIDISGFNDAKGVRQRLDEERDKMNAVYQHMKTAILALYPVLQLTESDVNDLTFSQLTTKFVLAEKILQLQKMVADPSLEFSELEIIDPEEQEIKRQKASQAEQERLARDPNPEKTTYGTASKDDPIAQQLHQQMQRAMQEGLI